MKSRFEEIDLFLKEMYKKYKQDPENFDDNTVYGSLKEYGLSERDKEDCTYEEIEMFRSIGIMPVSYYVPNKDEVKPKEWFSEMGFFTNFAQWADEAGENFYKYTSKNSYFFTFENTKFKSYEKDHEGKNPIKLYIPVGKDTFVSAIPALFKYLGDSDIMHTSKISAGVRADDVVIRVYNLTDAENLIEYVNENLKDKIITTNPFLIREGVVGVASDGTHSFNRDVSNHVANYIKQVDNEDVGIDSFRAYINNEIPNNHEQTREIMQILAISMDPDKTIQDYYEFWDRMTDIPHKKLDEKLKNRREGRKHTDGTVFVSSADLAFDKQIESGEFAKGLDARRKEEMDEKSRYAQDYKSAMDRMREKREIIAKVNEKLKETFRKMHEEDMMLKQKMDNFYTAMYGLAGLAGISRFEEFENLRQDASVDSNMMFSFIDETIELYNQKKNEHDENMRRFKEQQEKEVMERTKAIMQKGKEERERLEKLKQDPVAWKKYKDDQAEKRRKQREEKASVVSYLRKLQKDLENNPDEEIMFENANRVLKVVDGDEAK